jgi:predicted transcriptional regulator of viral defense system
MESSNNQNFNKVKATEAILQSDIGIIPSETLRNLLGISRHQAPFDLINSLVMNGILKRLEMGKYIIPSKKPSNFLIANFLYEPSYISFESALNFHGILSQFPFEITSATVKKTKIKEIDGNIYSYSHINKDLFWGYEKKDGFLIALPEKALLDQIYLSINGKRQIDMSEYDLSNIDKKRLDEYVNNIKKGIVKDKIIEIL